MYKRLCILLYSNNYRIVVLTDHEVIRRIVHYSILNIFSIDLTNRRLIITSVYLSAYLLEVYYILGRFNYMPDTLSRLCTIGDDVVRKNIVKPILDTFWDKDPKIEVKGIFFIFSEIYINNILRQ